MENQGEVYEKLEFTTKPNGIWLFYMALSKV